MTSNKTAPLATWLIAPLEPAVATAIDRLRRAPDVAHVAVMPDVHLATDVCIGTVIATRHLLYPQAVGGDIGCGMLAVGFDVSAKRISDPAIAGRILADFAHAAPPLRRNRQDAIDWPNDLKILHLSHPSLEQFAQTDGALQLGTVGSGNHFVELQADEEDRLWLMVHSGSRSMGQTIRDHHLARAKPVGSALKALDIESETGRAYLKDVIWAREFAHANRRAMAAEIEKVLANAIGANAIPETLISIDHNHVAIERHGNETLSVHRKGAMPAAAEMKGVLPGSMGTLSFHVEGRGCQESLCSSAHGAGRAMSREAARRKIRQTDLRQQMQNIWFDYRMMPQLCEEAPTAYKDIRAVLRAQHDLVKVTRTLRPVLNYKSR